MKETEASTQRSILAVRLSSAAGAPAGDHQNQAVSTEAHQGALQTRGYSNWAGFRCIRDVRRE